jgi:hypothetical protein
LDLTFEINAEGTAGLEDPSIVVTQDVRSPGADTSEPSFGYGWFVSFKFKLAYVFYTKAEDNFDWAVTFVPISDRGSSMMNSDVGFLNAHSRHFH